MTDLIFAMDILITFQVAFIVPNSLTNDMYERAPIKIAKNYMALPSLSSFSVGWFWLDVLTITPWDQLGCSSVRFLRILRLLRMVRLLRVLKILSRWYTRLG